jgi:opacity protein-like surface antigen
MKVLRVVLALVMLSSLSLAQEPQEEIKSEKESLKGKGFFIGIDLERVETDTRYSTSSSLAIYRIADGDKTYTEPAFKVGYQYYFTRIYFKYSQVDEATTDYTVDSSAYELNVEYMPVVYRGNSYAVRLFGGLSIGYTKNDLKDLSPRMIDQLALTGATDTSDTQALYGAQMGVMLEMSMGLSAEIGYRYRRGDLLEIQADSGDTTFKTKRKQLYVGLNYMF